MYISHKYKLIFLRTPKTASSSLSEFLIKNIDDPNAIYTPVDDTRIPPTVDLNIIEKYKNNTQYVHLTLEQLLEEGVITKDMINEYKCFAVIRDPIDRQKSGYYFRRKYIKNDVPASIQQYKNITKNCTHFKNSPMSAIRQTDFLTLNGEIKGEYWLYENIQEHLNQLMNDLNIKVKHNLPHHKSGLRKKPTEIEFDDEILNALNDYFSKDFELYNKLKG